jgi:hypothetical protein
MRTAVSTSEDCRNYTYSRLAHWKECSPGNRNEALTVNSIARKHKIPRTEEKYHIYGLLAYSLV